MKTWAELGIDTKGATMGEFDTQCPWCSKDRKKKQARCLSVNLDKAAYLCHHCGISGGLAQGGRRYEAGWDKPAYRRPDPVQQKPVSALADWFANRSIPESVLERNCVTPATVYMPQVEEHVGAVAFPYYRGEELVNVKYRDREKNFRMEAGAERILYGLNDIETERCVIVEGEIDKLSLEVAGITSCVSVPDGAPTPSSKDYASKFAFLEADEARLSEVSEWILAVDADEPGQRLCDELARRLGRERCKRVTWAGDCKDANDVLVSYGADVLRECIDNAEAFPLAGVFSLEDRSAAIRHLRQHGWEKGVSTGWEEVDQYYTVRPGEFTVVTGMPNSGKSNWLDALLVNLARDHGWRFALFSPENQPLEDHMARMMEKWAGEPFYQGPTERMSDSAFEGAMAWVDKHFRWILPDDDMDWTVDTVLDRAKSLVFRNGIRGVVIDPWNELEHAPPQGSTETIYTGQVLKRIRQFARRNGVHVWVVAHPAKLYRDKDSGSYPVPTLYDISGSANWRNKADNGVAVWRDFSDPHTPVEIHTQKIRFRQIGKVGMAKLKFHPVTHTYRDLGFDHPLHGTGSASRKRKKAE